MGVAPSFMPFLDRVHATRSLRGPAIGLGTLDLSGDLAAFGHPELMARAAGGRRAVGELLRLRYGLESYVDADINGLADLHLDLGSPAPEALRGRFSLVLNAGTLEHVFDLRQAFETIHDLAAPGAVILHIAPLTWMEHAFVNLSAKVFREVARSNGYTTELEAIWTPDPRSEGVLCFGPEFVDPRHGDQRLGPEELSRSATLPARLLYFGAFSPPTRQRFATPVDVGV